VADQVAVVPVRSESDGSEICLIRRHGARRWGIPKGYIDGDDTPQQAARTEAREEAGLTGEIEGPVGTYEYSKWGDRLTVAVYVMRVVDVLPVWDEMELRERRWVTVTQAERLLRRHPVWPLWEAITVLIGKRLAG
jgi:8-oxo-dGTP pyrophosphatase MutT (NUDIX family)